MTESVGLFKPPCIGNLEPGCSMKSTEALIDLLIDENRNLKYRYPTQIGYSPVAQSQSAADSTDVKILQNNLRQLELQLACGNKGGFGMAQSSSNGDAENKLNKCKIKNKMLKASLVGFADCESARKRLSEEVSVAKKLLADKMRELDDCKAQSAAKDVLIQQMSVAPPVAEVPVGGEDVLERIAAEAFGTGPSAAAATSQPAGPNLQPEVDRLRARVAELERTPPSAPSGGIPPDCVPRSQFEALEKRLTAELAEDKEIMRKYAEENISLNKANEDLEKQLRECQSNIQKSIEAGNAVIAAEVLPPATTPPPTIAQLPPPSGTPAAPSQQATAPDDVQALKDLGVEGVTVSTNANEYNQLWLNQKAALETQADNWFNAARRVLTTARISFTGPLAANDFLSKSIEAKLQSDPIYAGIPETNNIPDIKNKLRRFWAVSGDAMVELYTALVANLPADDAVRNQQSVPALLNVFCFTQPIDTYLATLGTTARDSNMSNFINGFKRQVVGAGSSPVPDSAFFRLSKQICDSFTSKTPTLVRP